MDVDAPVGLAWSCAGDWGSCGCLGVSWPAGMLFWL